MERDYKVACQFCAWFEDGQLYDKGTCHYNPPISGVSSYGQGGTYTVFPEVSSSDWCGKFQGPPVLEAGK